MQKHINQQAAIALVACVVFVFSKASLAPRQSASAPQNHESSHMKSNCFYPFTRTFCSYVGDMTSFIWGSYVGLWSIYKSGTELAGLSSTPKWRKIADHLTAGIPNQGGIDLKVITGKPWAEHQGTYTNFILAQGTILYEEWTSRLAEATSTPGKKVKAETYQFSAGLTSPKYINWSALDSLGAIAISPFLTSEVQPKFVATHFKNISSLDALLKWYRYFKELKNLDAWEPWRPADVWILLGCLKLSLKAAMNKQNFDLTQIGRLAQGDSAVAAHTHDIMRRVSA